MIDALLAGFSLRLRAPFQLAARLVRLGIGDLDSRR